MLTHNTLWASIGLPVLLSPLGLILPRLFNAGGAWGEWGVVELERIVGFAPEGMKRDSELWKAPLPDYTVPGQGAGMAGQGLGYLLTGIAGLAVTAGAAWV